MPKKITKEIALERVLNKCIEKNYTLVEDFVWIGSAKTYLKLRCNIDGHEWNTTLYTNFVNKGSGCPKCGGSLPITQEEAMIKVLDKCIEKNYTLVEPFIYIGVDKTHLKLRCNIDGYEWNTTSYSNFINRGSGCSKCAGSLTPTTKEAMIKVLDKCKEMNYTLVEPFIFTGSAKTYLKLRCNIDGHEWNTTNYNGFVNQNVGCPKCGGRDISQEVAEQRVLDKCKEKNYTLIEDFVWNGTAKTYLKLRCNIDGHEWNTTNYNGFVNQNKGCLKCNGTLIPTTEEANQRVLDKCKEKNYTLVEPFDYINAAKTYLKLKCDKGHEWNTTSYSSFININSGCPECGKEKQVNTMIEKYGEAYLHIIPRHNPYTIQFIDDLSEMTGLNFNHAANGGEKKFHKYWVDAYNEEHNIVIEFDEKHHNLQKESDQERQQYIVDNFGCKFVRVDWEQFIKNPEGEMELLVECVKNISSIV